MQNKRLLLLGIIALLAAGAQPGWCNALRDHPSPYLAMHGQDPVAWRAWNRGAIERARQEDKLLFISSGYFSCHWCHVMQEQSYRNPEIAALLNAHFIPVKVDRELQPALDAYLIEFVQRTQGRAGWPLNVFLTPEGHPLAGITYLPAESFLAYLKRLQALWAVDSAELKQLAGGAARALSEETPAVGRIGGRGIGNYMARFVDQALDLGDEMSGGFGNRAKFPSCPQLRVLLQRQADQPDPEVAAFLTLTLDQMAGQALRDHLGGGFFRYTVDPGWQVPHFEKMLYDNVQLAELYLDAARIFGESAYEAVARDTLDFLLEQMWDEHGAFISSLSAVDDQGVEGGYYLWDEATLKATLSEKELATARLAWSLDGPPPFEAGYLPVQAATPVDIGKALGLTLAEVETYLSSARRKLLERRSRRTVPPDTKLLAAWNGLALNALARAARLPGGETYRSYGKQVRDYLIHTLWDGQALLRARDRDKAVGSASLEDYAYVAQGLLAWADLSGEATDDALVRRLLDEAWQRFRSARGWKLADDSLLPGIPTEPILADGPLPSPTAILLDTSLMLANRLDDSELRDKALLVLRQDYAQLASSPFVYATHVGVLARHAGP